MSDAYFSMNGALSADNHSMSGIWVSNYPENGYKYSTFSGTGGNADPKPPSPTVTATLQATATLTPAPPTPTQPPVAGVAFDAPSHGGGAFDAGWLGAIAAAALVPLAGAALYARKRG